MRTLWKNKSSSNHEISMEIFLVYMDSLKLIFQHNLYNNVRKFRSPKNN
jgi:hypothetical protein